MIIDGTYQPNVDDGTCGKIPGRSKRIIGGTIATKGEFAFIAGLGYKNPLENGKMGYGCAGALINRYNNIDYSFATL